MSNPENHVSLDYLARLLRLGPRPARELAADGTFVRVARGKYDLFESVGRYADRTRATAAGRGGELGVFDLTQERAGLARAQKLATEFKLARDRGEYVLRETVDHDWTRAFTEIRQQMLSIPSKVAQRMTHLNREEIAKIDDAVREKLTDAYETLETMGLLTDV